MDHEVNGWTIEQHWSSVNAEIDGKWFVAKRLIPHDDWSDLYLHRDGIARKSTCCNGEWTGYFDTREEAEAAANAAN